MDSAAIWRFSALWTAGTWRHLERDARGADRLLDYCAHRRINMGPQST